MLYGLNQKQQARAEAIEKQNVRLILQTLKAAGVKKMTVTFDGCGDSGQIEDFTFDPPGMSAVLDTADLVATKFRSTYKKKEGAVADGEDDWGYVMTEEQTILDLRTLVENTVYDLLEDKHGGWEINEGSFGSFVFDVKAGKVKVEFNQRVETVETENYEVK